MSEPIVFFHGCPGSQRDATLACPEAWPVFAPNLFDPADPVEAGVVAISQAVNTTGGRVTLIGFSIGAMVAIKVATRCPDAIRSIVLLSPAAPLQLGNYLDRMAGRPVFELARKGPSALRLLVFAQRLAVRVAPAALLKQLFRDVSAKERDLLKDPMFRKGLIHGLASSLGAGQEGYIALLRLYVADWQSELDTLSAPVEIWHGDEDRWAPVDMAHDLAARIGPDTVVRILRGRGHYSTLASFREAQATAERPLAGRGTEPDG